MVLACALIMGGLFGLIFGVMDVEAVGTGGAWRSVDWGMSGGMSVASVGAEIIPRPHLLVILFFILFFSLPLPFVYIMFFYSDLCLLQVQVLPVFFC